MPRVKLTKTVIDALPTPLSDVVYWDDLTDILDQRNGDYCIA